MRFPKFNVSIALARIRGGLGQVTALGYPETGDRIA